MQEPLKALTQSYTRTKSKDYKSFARPWSCTPTSSNNTIFATPTATSAYFHANFIPARDQSF